MTRSPIQRLASSGAAYAAQPPEADVRSLTGRMLRLLGALGVGLSIFLTQVAGAAGAEPEVYATVAEDAGGASDATSPEEAAAERETLPTDPSPADAEPEPTASPTTESEPEPEPTAPPAPPELDPPPAEDPAPSPVIEPVPSPAPLPPVVEPLPTEAPALPPVEPVPTEAPPVPTAEPTPAEAPPVVEAPAPEVPATAGGAADAAEPKAIRSGPRRSSTDAPRAAAASTVAAPVLSTLTAGSEPTPSVGQAAGSTASLGPSTSGSAERAAAVEGPNQAPTAPERLSGNEADGGVLITLDDSAKVISASAVALAAPRIPSPVSIAVEFGRAGNGWAGAIIFNVWLRRQLRDRRMSQRQLAHMSGVNHSTISRLLMGDRTPSLDTATKLARALRVPTEEIGKDLGFAPERPPMPIQRVEAALRGDDDLDESDVRAIMQAYLARRQRRRLRALPPPAVVSGVSAHSNPDPPA